MAIKKLLKEGITYNSLITIFEECCSFLDFYETMKSYGIERKVSKVVALHFSGKGLENQGARAYSRIHEERLATPNSVQETSEDQANGNGSLHHDPSQGNQESPVSSGKNKPDSKLLNQEEGDEDWETEVAATSVPRKNFTLKCTVATPLSLDVEDFSSTQSRGNKGKESPRGVGVSTGSKISHDHSKTSKSCNVEVSAKKLPRGKATSAQVSGRKFESRSSTQTESRDKRTGSKNKPIDEGQLETRANTKKALSRKGNKEKVPKLTNALDEHSSGKESGTSANNQSSTNQELFSNVEVNMPGSTADQGVSSGHKKQPECTVIPSFNSDSSIAEVVEKFASVFIGDIAILVPLDNSGQVCDSGETASGQPCLGVEDQAGNSVADKSSSDKDILLTTRESSADAMELNQRESSHQSAFAASHPQLDVQLHPQDQTEKDSVTKCENVADSDSANTSVDEKVLGNSELSAGTDKIANQLESSFQAVTSGDSSVTDANKTVMSSDIHVNSGNNMEGDARDTSEEINHGEVTVTGIRTCGSVEDSVVSGENESGQNEPFLGTSESGFPWGNLQQLPHASFPEEGLVPERFVMSEGLACHVMNTSDMDHTRHDLQAELSSESSSTSGDSMDAVLRQPPLGAERGFTPDTVQQQPDQLPWMGSVNDGVYSVPPYPGGAYPQGALPTYVNPYGSFHQAQQGLPLMKPYYSSFGYPSQIHHAIPPHIIQPHHQVFMTPYLQYRNQMMFSNAMAPVAGFPSPAIPPRQLRPQMYQVWQSPASFSYSPVQFNGNPYYQTQESTGGVLDVGIAHLSNVFSQISSPVEYQIPIMGTSDSSLSVVRDESGTESPSAASSDSPFELMNASAKSSPFQPVCEQSIVSKSFYVQTESESDRSTSHDNQTRTEEELEEQEVAGSGDVNTVASLAHLCYKEVSGDDKVHLVQLTDHRHLNCSKEFSTPTISLDSEDLVHKQVTLLSREGSTVAMGTRLSPDGSSMDGVCCDNSSLLNIKGSLKENSAPTSSCQDSRQRIMKNIEIKDGRPSPKPQRVKGGRSRKTKHSQDRPPASGKLRSDVIPVNRVQNPEPVSKNGNDSYEQLAQRSTVSGNEKKTDGIRRTVRFSKEHVGLDALASDENCCKLPLSSDQTVQSVETTQSIEKDRESSRIEGSSQRYAEKSDLVLLSRPPKVERNSRKRVFNNRRHIGKQPLKHPSKAKEQHADWRTDTNNNSN